MENFKLSKIETPEGLEKNNESQVEQHEKMRESRIVLHFMRHGKPESLQEGSTDEERHLSEIGVQQALEKSENKDMSQSVAYGSPRVRSQETAAYVMAGNAIPETITPQEVNEFFNQDLKVGSKTGVMEELNFSGGSPEFSKESDKAYADGRYLEFIIKESDSLAERLGDKEATTLSIQAGNIAEIVKRYIEASSRWNKLINDPEKNYEENLDRFFGSHQGVIESFLYKVVGDNKTKADLIANSLSSKGGFDFVEGITIDVIQKDPTEDPEIVLEFSKKTEDGLNFQLKENISTEKLEKIIREKEEHFQKIEDERENIDKKNKLERNMAELSLLCEKINSRFNSINQTNLHNWQEFLRKNKKVSIFLHKFFSEKDSVDPYSISTINNENPLVSKERKIGLKEFEKFKKSDLFVNPELSKDDYLKIKDELSAVMDPLDYAAFKNNPINKTTFSAIEQLGVKENKHNLEYLFKNKLNNGISVFEKTGKIFSEEAEIEFQKDIENIISNMK
jgi:broad specificity phosphatase PhoE